MSRQTPTLAQSSLQKIVLATAGENSSLGLAALLLLTFIPVEPIFAPEVPFLVEASFAPSDLFPVEPLLLSLPGRLFPV